MKNSNSTQPKQDWDAVMDTMEGLLGEATSLANPIIDKNHIGSEGIVQVWTHVRVFPELASIRTVKGFFEVAMISNT